MDSKPAILLVVVAAAFALGTIRGNAQTGAFDAAAELAPTAGRYQISAFGDALGGGYYIIDTVTGETWHNVRGNSPKRISPPLVQQQGRRHHLLPQSDAGLIRPQEIPQPGANLFPPQGNGAEAPIPQKIKATE